jgi:hypothetical protein
MTVLSDGNDGDARQAEEVLGSAVTMSKRREMVEDE